MAVGNAAIAGVVGDEESRLGVLGDCNLPCKAETTGNLRGGSSNRGRAHALEPKGEKPSHYGNDRNHDQQLDEREAAVLRWSANRKTIWRQN